MCMAKACLVGGILQVDYKHHEYLVCVDGWINWWKVECIKLATRWRWSSGINQTISNEHHENVQWLLQH